MHLHVRPAEGGVGYDLNPFMCDFYFFTSDWMIVANSKRLSCFTEVDVDQTLLSGGEKGRIHPKM